MSAEAVIGGRSCAPWIVERSKGKEGHNQNNPDPTGDKTRDMLSPSKCHRVDAKSKDMKVILGRLVINAPASGCHIPHGSQSEGVQQVWTELVTLDTQHLRHDKSSYKLGSSNGAVQYELKFPDKYADGEFRDLSFKGMRKDFPEWIKQQASSGLFKNTVYAEESGVDSFWKPSQDGVCNLPKDKSPCKPLRVSAYPEGGYTRLSYGGCPAVE